jgi:hypothetical protein
VGKVEIAARGSGPPRPPGAPTMKKGDHPVGSALRSRVEGRGWRVDHAASLARTPATCVGCHLPPLGIGTPWRVSSSAAARTPRLATPARTPWRDRWHDRAPPGRPWCITRSRDMAASLEWHAPPSGPDFSSVKVSTRGTRPEIGVTRSPDEVAAFGDCNPSSLCLLHDCQPT